jgi:hypothetical protein
LKAGVLPITFTKGYELKGVTILNKGKAEKANYLVNDTRMQIKLKDTLRANGTKIQVKIDYAYDVSEYGTDRTGRLKTRRAGYMILPNGTRVWRFTMT